MNRLSLGFAIASLGLLLAHSAGAQVVCPTADVGSACDGGTCLSGSCTFATGDGGQSESACGLCVANEPGECFANDAGSGCADGSVCRQSGAGAGGGSTTTSPEAGTLVGFTYGIGFCETPHEAGTGDDGDDSGSGDDASADEDEDAGSLGTSRDAAVTPPGSGHGADASASDAATSGGSSGGCRISSSTPATSVLPVAAVLGFALLRRRRTRHG